MRLLLVPITLLAATLACTGEHADCQHALSYLPDRDRHANERTHPNCRIAARLPDLDSRADIDTCADQHTPCHRAA